MNTGVYVSVLGLLVYVRSAPTRPETVWLTDVTTIFQTDKRIIGDHDLPAQLTFHLRRGSDDLTLNLRRNYEIDPNADIYVLQKMNDGRSVMKKATISEREDVAYYQDMDNGAYMTVRCVKKSNQKCERVINGNLNIEDSSYDLHPAETIDSSGHVMEIPDLIGKRYLLQDQNNFQPETLVENKDAANDNATNVAIKLKDLLRRFTGLDKLNYFNPRDSTLSAGNVASLRDREETDKTRQLKHDYYVNVAVLIDSGVWDIYSYKEKTVDPLHRNNKVQKRIREAFSHIMNGVNLRYKSIEDPRISISVILHSFRFFEGEDKFPHKLSKVDMANGTKYIESYDYLYDLGEWDNVTSASHPASFDHAMLFTRHELYNERTGRSVRGKSFLNGVCDVSSRVSIIQVSHYEQAVRTAAHELGHNLGADHDGKGDAIACKPEDLFLMTSKKPKLSKDRTYIKNIWKFSKCSVESFLKNLQTKDCVKTPGSVYNMDEWTRFMTQQAGDVFTPDELCYLFYGPGSKFTGDFTTEICFLLRCKDPSTGKYVMTYVNAARGTKCGHNKICMDGKCVAKHSE